MDRRAFVKSLGAGLALAGIGMGPHVARSQAAGRVVIVGGGAGGASVAAFLRKAAPELSITLLEPNKAYVAYFFANRYLGGFRSLDSLIHTYDGLVKQGITLLPDRAIAVDPIGKTVRTAGEKSVSYDILVLAPGIDFLWETIEGYGPEAAKTLPHAWRGGRAQLALLHRQILDMDDGGVVVIAPPGGSYRCPPGPYERASLIAHYLKFHKPAAKLVILDAKKTFPSMPLFQDAWKRLYGDLIEWVDGEATGGGVVQVDPRTMTLTDGAGNRHKATVANVIPAQTAGRIAHEAGCVKGDWCPIQPATFESTLVPNVFVLGDAALAADMPKSAFAAHSQAAHVANVIAARLAGKKLFPPRYRNNCWSLLATNDAIKAGASYQAGETKVEIASEFASRVGEDAQTRARTFRESEKWYTEITAHMFGKLG